MLEGFDRVPVQVRVNGTLYERTIEPRVLLVDFIREDLDLTGTHIGCDTTYCGACTVLIDGEAVKSCSVFAVQANGRKVTTIEGLAENGTLHPVQQAFWEEHGLQCGFCTPGLIMSTVYLLSKKQKPTDQEIRKGIAGNTCRCTGYQNVFKAIRAAAADDHG